MRDGMSDLRHVTTLAVKIVFIRQTHPHAPILGRSFVHTRHVQNRGFLVVALLSGYSQIKKEKYIILQIVIWWPPIPRLRVNPRFARDFYQADY
jgi:hypothetical protein